MALQSSGAIKLSEVQTEFGGSNPISISEYYGEDTGIPASGTIAMSDFYGTSASIYPFTINVALVAGGGGGGTANANGGAGGGGGGQYKPTNARLISYPVTWTITVGGGGPAKSNGTRSRIFEGSTQRANSTYGGRGASYNVDPKQGGGGSQAYPTGKTRTNQGDGGNSSSTTGSGGGGGGGGGPSGTNGGNNNGDNGGAAGSGTNDSTYGQYGQGGSGGSGFISGDAFAGSGGGHGGGVGAYYYSFFGNVSATNGSANTGGGGGGGSSRNSSLYSGASGGSGRVMIRMPDDTLPSSTTGTVSVTTDGSFKIYTFLSSGSITWS